MSRKIDVITRRKDLNNWNRLREPRVGIMLHFDASANDAGAVDWLLRHPDCKVSYNRLVLDDGTEVVIAPDTARAWHAGSCKASDGVLGYTDANSAFYGLAFAARGGDTVTSQQLATAAAIAAMWMFQNGWTDVERHITDHAAEAWPRGRKTDIRGLKGVTLESFRKEVKRLLDLRRVNRVGKA
jgi:N-acetyl-anhydromuramyl-L-alanine amidase AmpD